MVTTSQLAWRHPCRVAMILPLPLIPAQQLHVELMQVLLPRASPRAQLPLILPPFPLLLLLPLLPLSLLLPLQQLPLSDYWYEVRQWPARAKQQKWLAVAFSLPQPELSLL